MGNQKVVDRNPPAHQPEASLSRFRLNDLPNSSGPELAKRKMGFKNVFGATAYRDELDGAVGTVPPLPEDLESILDEYFPGSETTTLARGCQLVLVPDELNGEPFTIQKLYEQVCNVTAKRNVTAEREISNGFFHDVEIMIVDDSFPRTAPKAAFWTLVPKSSVLEERWPLDDLQLAEVAKSGFQLVPLIVQAVTVQLNYLRAHSTGNSNRPNAGNSVVLCEERHPQTKNRIAFGNFGTTGARFTFDQGDNVRYNWLGLGIHRPLSV